MGWLSDFTDDVLGFDPNEGGIFDVLDGDSVIDFVNDGMTWLTGAVMPDTPSFGDDSARDRSILANVSSNVAKIPVIYGTRRVGGIRVFHGVSGSSNEFYWRVFVLSEGEIAGIDNVYLDGLISTDTKFGSTVQITKYVGTDTQTADAGLMAAFPGKWTVAHAGPGTAYIIVRLTFDPSVYDRMPDITADVRGRKVYDPRDALVKFSANSALCIHDYLTHTRYGKRLPTALLNTPALIVAANDCESQIAAWAGGPNINMFESNAVVDTSQDIKRNVEELLTSCRGYLPYTGGLYTLVIDKDTAPVMTMTADNIIGGWSIQGGSKRTRQNRVKAKFTNPAKDWQPDYAITDSATLRTQDAGLLLEAELQFPFEINYYRALYHTEVAMKRSRQGLICSFVAAPEALKVEIGDVVAVTHATPGWTAKKFRVTGLTLRADGLVAMTCQEHEPTAYDRTVPVEAATPADTYLPDPKVVVAPVSLGLFSGDTEIIMGTDGTLISRIRVVTPISPSIYVIGTEVDYKLSSATAWNPAGFSPSRSESTMYVSPAKDGENYDIRARYLNAMGFYSPYITTVNYTVVGKTAPPPPVSNFLVNRQSDGTRDFTWTYPTPPNDLYGFKIKYKLGAGGLWANMVPLHTEVLNASPYETNQLAAGTYTFAIVAVDTTGNESTPVYIEATLLDPRLAGVIISEYPNDTGWPGIKTSCWKDNTGVLLADSLTQWDALPVSWDSLTAWAISPVSPIAYEHTPLDIGVLMAFTPFVTVDTNGSQTITMSTSSDGVTYTAFVPPGLVTARYIKIKVSVTGVGLLMINKVQIFLSAPIKSEGIEDKNTSTLTGLYRIGVGDIRLPITKSYAIIRRVAITLQNVGSGWTWELIDKSTTTGPRIKIYNGSVLADAVIDAYIEGS